MFRTERRGWGIRCLDDIPKGQFICVYAGQLLTEQEANVDGKQFGDEYLAELDLIESIEQAKDGYESEVDIDIDYCSDISQSSSSGEICGSCYLVCLVLYKLLFYSSLLRRQFG